MALLVDTTFLAARHAWTLSQSAADPYRAAKVEARFRPLAPYVHDAPKVGYLASRAIGASEQDEVEHSIARYALVPTLLCNHPNQPLVITNIDTDGQLDELMRTGAFEQVVRLGRGSAVLRRIAK